MRMRQQQLHSSLDFVRRVAYLLDELLLQFLLLLFLALVVNDLVEVLDKGLLEIDFGLATVVYWVQLEVRVLFEVGRVFVRLLLRVADLPLGTVGLDLDVVFRYVDLGFASFVLHIDIQSLRVWLLELFEVPLANDGPAWFTASFQRGLYLDYRSVDDCRLGRRFRGTLVQARRLCSLRHLLHRFFAAYEAHVRIPLEHVPAIVDVMEHALREVYGQLWHW